MPTRKTVAKMARICIPDIPNGATKLAVLASTLVDGVAASKLTFHSAKWAATNGLQATLRFERTAPKNIVTMAGVGSWEDSVDSDGAGLTGDLEVFVAGGGAGQGLTLHVTYSAEV